MKNCLFVLFVWGLAISAMAQSDSLYLSGRFWAVNKGTSLGIGSAKVYDTYLSPLEYTGTAYSFQHERISRKKKFDGKLIKQQIFNLNFTDTENPAGNASAYSLLGEYRLGFHYPVYAAGHFRIRTGAVWNIGGGVIYNERNSNNPASAKAYTNLNLSGQTFYQLGSCVLRWQLDIPFAGVFFTPEYGESYYEISLGNHSNLFHFSSFHNQRSLLSNLSADFPISNWTIRMSLQSSFLQTRANSLISHIYTQNILIGLVSESVNLGGRKLRKTSVFRSAFSE